MVNDSSVSQFQLIVCGLGKIDINDWKSNTRLKHCTTDSNIVKWFWRAVESYDEEKRARLLQFVTGSSRVPLQGFKALQGTWCPLAWVSHSGSRKDNHTYMFALKRCMIQVLLDHVSSPSIRSTPAATTCPKHTLGEHISIDQFLTNMAFSKDSAFEIFREQYSQQSVWCKKKKLYI